MLRLFLMLSILVIAAPAWAQSGYGGGSDTRGVVRANVQERLYPVIGLSEQDILQGMSQEGPEWQGRRFFGLTTSEVSYAYWKQPTSTGCDLRDIVVTANVTIVLPQWTADRSAPYALTRSWRQFDRALRHHENGHRDLVLQEAEQIRNLLAGLRTSTCDAMDDEARRRVAAVRGAHTRQHEQYDARTEHGRTQGAQWPLGR